jgi:hypothetical protein
MRNKLGEGVRFFGGKNAGLSAGIAAFNRCVNKITL